MNTKRNALIISALIIIILFGSVFYIISSENNAAKYAYIYINDELIKTVELSNVKENYRFTIEGENGCYNIIEVRTDGSIGVVDADCPDGLCKNMGFINSDALPITCLPNHIVIELSDDKNTESEGKIDGISY